MPKKKTLIVIIGPTAVGKTATCITLSQQLNAPIVSADSRQCYEKMNIGVAKPTAEEQRAAPHHLIDFVPLTTPYSAGAYQIDALACLEKIWENNPYAILTGGSGLYINAVCKGIPYMPPVPRTYYEKRYDLYKKKGLPPLLAALKSKDPTYYTIVDKKNPTRIIRALALCEATGKTFTSFREQPLPHRNFNMITIGLQRPRALLYERINLRVDQMMEKGLWEEATSLYPYKHLPALATIGYREIFDCLNGKYSQKEAIEYIKRNTRHYAKKQGTWFRKTPNIPFFDPTNLNAISSYIQRAIA